MKEITAIILISVVVLVPVLAQQSQRDYPTEQPRVRFAPLHVYLDSAGNGLAAFQFELKATAGQVKIVGVEGGSHEAFSKTPPYYDPAALANNRIIIAAFSTQPNLPRGRTRIATLHLQILGDAEPQYELTLTVAADADGEKIPAKVSFEKGEHK